MKMLVTQSCLTLSNPWTVAPSDSSVHGISQTITLEQITITFSPGDLPNLRIKPRFPTLQADSLASEPPGNTEDRADDSARDEGNPK